MKALRIHRGDGSGALSYEETEAPQLRSPTDVLVKLVAAAVGPVETHRLLETSCQKRSFSPIAGADGAGKVVAVGPRVRAPREDDAVCVYPVLTCGQCAACGKSQELACAERRILGVEEDGTNAEYVRVPARNCIPMPAGLTFEEAAALPLAYGTAWRMLFTLADLRAGETVLIFDSQSGIGTAALQLALAGAARVFVASRRTGTVAAAKRFGAHEVIDSPVEDVAREVRRLTGKRGADVVVNTAGGATWRPGLAALARGGRLVTCGASAGAVPKTDLRRVFWNHLTILAAGFPTREELRRVWFFFDGTGRRPLIDRVFSLQEGRSAYQRLHCEEPFGAIILRIDA